MALTKVRLGGFEPQYVGRRNIVINGAMQVAQRGTSVTGLTSGAYNTADRFYLNMGTAGTWTNTISTDVPTGQGFANSFKLDCTTANASLSAGSYMTLQHRIEAQNLQYIKKGTANAESLTLSFWVKSAKTGTYVAYLKDDDNDRDISKSYTISSANTWEKKTITFPPDTTGALNNDNGIGLYIYFWLVAGRTYLTNNSSSLQTTWASSATSAAGQVNLADSTSNDWYLTGVQLEVGSAATPFEHRSYAEELALCQRYYERIQDYSPQSQDTAGNTSSEVLIGLGLALTSTRVLGRLDGWKVTKRVPPTVSISADSQLQTIQTGSWYSANNTINFRASIFGVRPDFTHAGNFTAGGAVELRFNADGTNAYIEIDAEL